MYIRLDHDKIKSLMETNGIRPIDVAKRLRISRQLANYILHVGGVKWASRLANIFKITRNDLIINGKF